jgi:N-acetylneuraminate synthase
MKSIKKNKFTGFDQGLYFIADIGANHDGSIDRAFKLIELAKESGADAAKFQNFKAEKIVSKYGFENMVEKFSHQSNWKKSVYEVYEEASLNDEWTLKLKQKCEEVGIDYFTSPYDFESVDNVDPFVDLYKIGSGDITWLEIIEYIAKKNKPIILATGASDLEDVQRAMSVLESYTNTIVLMQCNTNYTGNPDNFNYINLNVLKTYARIYPDVILGLSDHTIGHSTVLGAISLGARIFEKHFTDDNNREGPDHKFAMNPDSWREMVVRSNELYVSLGDGIKIVEPNEEKSQMVQRRSIRVNKEMKAGEIIKYEDMEFLRPITEDGFPPYKINELIGKKVIKDILKGEHLSINNVRL